MENDVFSAKKNKKNMSKTPEHFSAEILAVLQDGFDSGIISVEPEELTEFMHALANIVPCHVHGSLTNAPLDLLAFNHLANHLVMQHVSLVDPPKAIAPNSGQ